MTLQPFKDVLAGQFRGRKRSRILAFLLSSIILILRFYLQRPTCELMFHRADLVKDYTVFWLCLFVFVGLTNRGKLVFGIVTLLWLGTRPMVDYRVPMNEVRAVNRLREMQATLKAAQKPMRELTDIVNPALISRAQLSGYVFEYVPKFSERGSLEHYVVKARPFCYCVTGHRSFAMEDTGAIHYTADDRAATVNDAILKRE